MRTLISYSKWQCSRAGRLERGRDAEREQSIASADGDNKVESISTQSVFRTIANVCMCVNRCVRTGPGNCNSGIGSLQYVRRAPLPRHFMHGRRHAQQGERLDSDGSCSVVVCCLLPATRTRERERRSGRRSSEALSLLPLL